MIQCFKSLFLFKDILNFESANRPRWHGIIDFLSKVSHLIPKLRPPHEIASKVQDLKLKVGKLKETGSSYGFISAFDLVFHGMIRE